MTSLERIDELKQMRRVFYDRDTTDETRATILGQIQVFAAEEMPDSYCALCRAHVIFIEYDRALVPGHIYSDAGAREFRNNTGWCEFCFDNATQPLEPE